jgi:uncharacterized membrane protein
MPDPRSATLDALTIMGGDLGVVRSQQAIAVGSETVSLIGGAIAEGPRVRAGILTSLAVRRREGDAARIPAV